MMRLITSAVLILLALPVWAAFPTLTATQTSGEAGAETSHGLDLPATINAGDVCIALFANDSDATVTWDDSTVGAWTSMFTSATGTNVRLTARKKVMAGTEDGASLTITTSAGIRSAHHVSCWGNVEGGVNGVEHDTFQGTSANPDPPSLTPSWGSADVTWAAVTANDTGTNGVITAYPEPDNQATHVSNAASTGVVVGFCSDEATASSRNPGTYTITGSDQWQTATIAIRGAAAANNAAARRRRM